MKPVRPLIWTLAVALLLLAITSLGPDFRRRVTAKVETPPPVATTGAGVVCFGTVDLEQGIASLLPLQPGRVEEVLVHENQDVTKGAELIRIDERAAQSKLAEATAALNLAKIQREKAGSLPRLQLERISRQQGVQDAMSDRLVAARQALVQRKQMAKTATLTAMDIAASESQVRELEALVRIEASRLADLKSEDVEAEVRRAEYEVSAARSRLEQAQLALDECRLKAPRPGTVLRLLVGPGDVLGGDRGQAAVLFAAEGPQIVRATVEQEFAPRIKMGDSALIQDEADHSTSYHGRVERIAAWYSQRRAVLHDPSQLSDVRTLECVIALDPDTPKLRLGQSVRVSIGAVPR